MILIKSNLTLFGIIYKTFLLIEKSFTIILVNYLNKNNKNNIKKIKYYLIIIFFVIFFFTQNDIIFLQI